MKSRFDDPHRGLSRHGLRLAGIDLYWIVAIGITLIVLRLLIWLLAMSGLIGDDDAAAAFLIALPAAVVVVAWLTPVEQD